MDRRAWLVPIGIAVFLVLISLPNYLLFHTAAEFFAILVAILFFVVAWTTYPFSKNFFLMYLGCGYFWIGMLDSVHTLVYKGMAIYPITVADPATQFWIATRFSEALLLLTAPFFLNRTAERGWFFFGFGVVATVLYFLIMTGNFPEAFIEGQGLTPFKIISEYVIIVILIGALIFLVKRQEMMEPLVFARLTLAILFTMVAELAFTFYVDVYDLSNLVGHIFKLFSFWLIFEAVVLQSLKDPYLKLEQKVRKRTKDLEVEIIERKRAEEALKGSEAKWSGMLSIAPDAIIATDINLQIQVFNEGAEKVFGYTAEEAVGQALDILIPGGLRTKHNAHVEAFLASGEVSRLMTERNQIFGLRKDGTEFPADASVSKLELGDDVILTVILHDISERKRIETELLSAKERAEYSDRAKSEFLANMSHELRTPLNAIIGFSEMMKRKIFGSLGNPHYDEYSNGIFESGEHLLSLINDILDISRIEAGQAGLNETILDAEKVTQGCLRLIEARAMERGLSIRNEVGSHLPFLKADERLFKQMLLNLLSNAIKFTESGGEITIAGELAKDGLMSLSVTDTGIGISVHDIPKAMSTFGQVDGDLDRRFEGTGLGLPLVKSLAELHGGGLEIESEVGVGTKATIWFPKERVVGSES